ncbi:MAG: RHS repeat-associated core domain-containing protein [Acidobacteriota bacterium]|nr:RHS repeat-associated core domain-containing protein [Acidobacteriota bacterium]
MRRLDEGKEESVRLLNVMESASGLKSLRLSSGLGASYSFSKSLAMPDRYPFDVSDESFGIRAKKVGRAEKEEETERILKLRLERFMKGKRGASSGSSINKPVQNQVSSSNIEIRKAGGTAVITNTGASILSVGSTGTYYVYSFDGKLLSEYNGLGECLRDYIYLGDRLLAEYQPQTGQIYYYTSDQVNSTRVVTDQNGVRVFAATYDPYGGIQKIWENSYMPAMKFSGKERDTESNLDYFGARYYGNYYYRWLSPDPVINKDAALSNPQLWNLYAFCHNNPVTYWDPDGAIVWTDQVGYDVIKASMSDAFLAQNISWNAETGLIDVNRSIRTDNTNYIALMQLVDSPQKIMVSVTDKVVYVDRRSEIKASIVLDLAKQETRGIMLPPRHGRKNDIMVNVKDYILCAVANMTDKSFQAQTLAEELYGHAWLYVQGLPFLHERGSQGGGLDKNGFVNKYIGLIKERKY